MIPKKPPLRDKAYLLHQRDQRCLVCGRESTDNLSVVAAHIGTAGRGLKSGDDETIPLCHYHHSQAHQFGETGYLLSQISSTIWREALRAWCREQYQQWAIERR
jgi:hypothetical protein